MIVVYLVTGALLGVSALLVAVRLLLGPTPHDRVVALDTLVVLVVSGIAVIAAARRDGADIPLLMVVSLVGFLSSVAVVRLMPGDRE